MTQEDLQEIGLPYPCINPAICLMVESALEWVLKNTTLEFDPTNLEEVKQLPSGVKLFLIKYVEVMNATAGVQHENLQNMTLIFSSTEKGELLRQYASELMGDALKSEASFFRAKNRWSG